MNDLGDASITTEKVLQLLEEQLTYMKQQNGDLSKQNKDLLKRIEALTEQVRQLTKALYGSKSEKSKYQAPDGQGSLFEEDPSFSDSEHTEEQSTATITYTVVRKINKKKRNDSFRDGIEIEEIHHHPENTQCDCCLGKMTEAGMTMAREEAKFIPATMKRVQHIEHAYECRHCKKDANQKAQLKRGKAPQGTIQRSIAGPTVLAKLIYDKFIQYLPLYRQVKEWERYGLLTNDKNLSNWAIRAAEDWLL
ncbi:MAG: IS66 family transposase zinc-finger binding domain-containing protein, partial [Lysinibacillus sp.]